jgi:hypothetical protein
MALLSDVPQWVRRVSEAEPAQIEPRSGSSLLCDDRWSGKFSVSGAAWNHITVAVDHLSTLRAATVGCGEHETLTFSLHISGQFTLLRAVIENAAAALWLLAPIPRGDRVLRRLQLAANDIRSNEAVRALTNSPGRKTKEQRLDEVRAIAIARGLDPKSALQAPSYEKIVRTAGEATGVGADLAVVLWRSCSGLAHGDVWASLAVPAREGLAMATAGMANLHLSPNVEALLCTIVAGKILVREAMALYEQRRDVPCLVAPVRRSPKVGAS